MEQEPLRVFPTAHFRGALAVQSRRRDLARANSLVNPTNRYDLWTIDGDAIRWLGVALFSIARGTNDTTDRECR